MDTGNILWSFDDVIDSGAYVTDMAIVLAGHKVRTVEGRYRSLCLIVKEVWNLPVLAFPNKHSHDLVAVR